MSNSHKSRGGDRTKPLLLAMALGVAVSSGVPGLPHHAGEPSRGHTVAKVIAVSGPALVFLNGRSRRLATGQDVGANEVIVTCAYSTALVTTADGGRFNIYPGSRATFRDYRWVWLSRTDRWLRAIRARVHSFGGPAPSMRLTLPTVVLSVRAANVEASTTMHAPIGEGEL